MLLITVRLSQIIRNSYLMGDKAENLATSPDMADKICRGDMACERINFSLKGSFRFIVKNLHGTFLDLLNPIPAQHPHLHTAHTILQ